MAASIRRVTFRGLVDLYLSGDLLLDELVSARGPLDEAAHCLDDLAAGGTLRQLLIP